MSGAEWDAEAVRARLLQRRAALEDQSRSSAEARRPVELDQQSVGRVSRVDALQQQAMAQASEANRREEVRRIDAALKRLADGDYGFCQACDEPIPVKRLNVDPTATLCVSCAR